MAKLKIKDMRLLRIITCFTIMTFLSCTNFSIDTPDTKGNIRGFKSIIDVPKTDDVKDIYFFADELGFEPLYQFSFSCDISTINRIINEHKLKKIQKDPNDIPIGVGQKFKWWDCMFVDTLNLHWSRFDTTANHVIDLWYDSKNSRGYYLYVQL